MNKNRRRYFFSVTRFFSEDIRKKLVSTNRIWLWVAFIAASAVVLMISAIGSVASYEVGDIASKSLIYEGATFSYTSDVAYEKAVENIKADVNDVYTLDSTKLETLNSGINDFIAKMTQIKAMEDPESDAAVSIYKSFLGDGDDAAVYESALNSLPPADIKNIGDSLSAYFASSYAEGIKEADLDAYLDDLSEWIDSERFSEAEKTAANAIVSTLKIEANYVLNKEETDAVTEKRISEIQPVEITVRSGEKIVDEGTEITEEQMESLQKAGMLSERKGVAYYIGTLFYVLFLYFLLFLFCKRFFPFYAFEKAGIMLIGFVLVVFLIFCQIILLAASYTTGTLYSVLGYLLPLPAVAMVFATLTNQRLAFIATTYGALLMAPLVTNQPFYLLVTFAAALFTVYSVGRIRERYQVVSYGIYLGFINALLILIVGLLGEQSLRTVAVGCLVGLIGGFVSSFFALGSIPVLENSLKLTTPMKLMELSSTGHPLIKRLMAEAPGTYYHSVLVGNLAEAAADAVGADALLVRVASYYHDVGKLERPAYFTENQTPGNNPHDKLTPSMSALILVSHVKDGIEMTKEYGLPEDVINIIAEHHGDGVISYFYHKAKEQGDDVTEEDFSYPYPKPQTKESAIVMMADTVQAALQSMDAMTKGEIAAKIHALIKSRLNDGQFEECDLTFKDLHIIQDAFVSVYDGMTHHRIKYPDLKALAKKSGMKVEVKEPAAAAEIAATPPEKEEPHHEN